MYGLSKDSARRIALTTRRAERIPRGAEAPPNYKPTIGYTRRAIVVTQISAASGANAGDGTATLYYLKIGNPLAVPKVLGQYLALPGLSPQIIYNWTTSLVTVGTIIRVEWTGGAWEYLGSNC